MNRIGKFVIAFALHITSFSRGLYGQELQVGEFFPNITINNVLNHKTEELRLSDFKGKFIILDFWAFYCTSCLKSFPKLDSLQKTFKNSIQLILINKENKEKTKQFLANHSRIQMPKGVPIITSDSLINTFFPHNGVPAYVWIDNRGKISYRSDEALTEDDIKKFVKGQKVILSENIESKYISSLFDKDYERNIIYSTYLAKCSESEEIHIEWKDDNIPYDCRSIKDLYQFAYNESDYDSYYLFREHGRTIMKVKDPYKYEFLPGFKYHDWYSKYGYYYHAILPKALEPERFKILQADLHRYFNLKVSIEKQKVKCLALIRTSSKDKLKTKGGLPRQTSFSTDLRSKDNDLSSPPIRYIRNKSFSSLFDIIKSMGDWTFFIKVVDETGYSGPIDFQIKEQTLQNLTIDNLRKALLKYDLDLVEKYIPMDVLVLSD